MIDFKPGDLIERIQDGGGYDTNDRVVIMLTGDVAVLLEINDYLHYGALDGVEYKICKVLFKGEILNNVHSNMFVKCE